MDANGFYGTLLRSILIALLKVMKPNSKDSLKNLQDSSLKYNNSPMQYNPLTPITRADTS